MESMINKKELINDGEKSDRKTMVEIYSTGNILKRRKILKDSKMGVAAEYEDIAQMNKGGDKKKKEKKEKSNKASGKLVQNVTSDGMDSMEGRVASQCFGGHIVDKGGFALERRKKDKRNHVRNSGAELQGFTAEKMGTESTKVQVTMFSENDVNVQSTRDETGHRNVEVINVNDGEKRKKAKSEILVNGEDSSRNMEAVNVKDGKQRKKEPKSRIYTNVEDCDGKSDVLNLEDSKKRKRSKSEKQGTVEDCNRNVTMVNVIDSKKRKEATSKKHVIISDNPSDEHEDKIESRKGILKIQRSTRACYDSENSTPKKASKRVKFSDHVEVFSLSDYRSDVHEDLVRGKRFSKEEDKIIKQAVLRYIEAHALGDDGLDMVLHCKSHPEFKNHPELKSCWKDIGEALPWRPFKSVCYRAHVLFERAEECTWTSDEYEEIRKFHKEHGADWRALGDKLGKHRIHVKDAWRRIKLPNQKKGCWSQEEYESLFDLVNKDMRMKVSEEKKTKHGMLRDNICWEAIRETLGSRTNAVCSMKWYNQLSSTLVKQKLWADIDDYHLLDALNSLDACCIEDVDWDDLLEHSPGDVCQKRWNQMVKHIGHHALKSFSEQVEVLSKRYLAVL